MKSTIISIASLSSLFMRNGNILEAALIFLEVLSMGVRLLAISLQAFLMIEKKISTWVVAS